MQTFRVPLGGLSNRGESITKYVSFFVFFFRKEDLMDKYVLLEMDLGTTLKIEFIAKLDVVLNIRLN